MVYNCVARVQVSDTKNLYLFGNNIIFFPESKLYALLEARAQAAVYRQSRTLCFVEPVDKVFFRLRRTRFCAAIHGNNNTGTFDAFQEVIKLTRGNRH